MYLTPQFRCTLWEFCRHVWCEKTGIIGLLNDEKLIKETGFDTAHKCDGHIDTDAEGLSLLYLGQKGHNENRVMKKIAMHGFSSYCILLSGISRYSASLRRVDRSEEACDISMFLLIVCDADEIILAWLARN